MSTINDLKRQVRVANKAAQQNMTVKQYTERRTSRQMILSGLAGLVVVGTCIAICVACPTMGVVIPCCVVGSFATLWSLSLLAGGCGL